MHYRLFFWTSEYQNRRPINGHVQALAWYEFQRRGLRIPFPAGAEGFLGLLPPAGAAAAGGDGAETGWRIEHLLRSDFGSRVLGGEAEDQLRGDPSLPAMAREMRHLRFMKGETLFRQGDRGDSCYVVARGALRGRIEYRGLQQPHEFDLAPGALFGEMSLMTGLPRMATIQAVGEVELLEITGAAFAKLLALRPGLPERLSELIAAREAGNHAAYAQLASVDHVNFGDHLKKESLLSRFMRLLGGE